MMTPFAFLLKIYRNCFTYLQSSVFRKVQPHKILECMYTYLIPAFSTATAVMAGVGRERRQSQARGPPWPSTRAQAPRSCARSRSTTPTRSWCVGSCRSSRLAVAPITCPFALRTPPHTHTLTHTHKHTRARARARTHTNAHTPRTRYPFFSRSPARTLCYCCSGRRE